MIPKLHDKTGTVIGDLTDCLKGITIEERNGMLEAEITYQLFSPHWDKLIRGNIFTADVNDKIKNQQFRIYKVGKTIKGVFNVYARHISYDAQRDMIEGLDIQNQSCEYCLNTIFRNSQFSQKFRGHSDIVNAQNFKIGPTKLLSAIGGVRGSIIDTFGTGAEILRDNYDFYVLNKRGNDNGVTIEYSKNMTGLDYTEDEEGLITRIKAIAKYTPEGGEETEIFTYVDSHKILDYETPFIETIDFSDKFEDEEIPTTEKLKILGEKYFKNNKCDFVKFNYKVSFIPLSKCAGYEDIQDKIELCDTVGIKDYRYNLDTKAKVIKTTYDFLRERYDSMEVGEPRTTLGDVVGGGSEESKPGPPGPQGPPGADGNIGDFPDSLPSVPVLSSKVYGFANIELSWTFENKVYYSYELYASKIKDFIPNAFDLIHQGQSSSFLFQANPNETWYFKVCCVNSHGNRTGFSTQVTVTTKKIDNLSNYVNNMAIGEALIGTLSLDRGWIGTLRGHYIDARELTVTDGNGKRTLDVDSFGNTSLTGTFKCYKDATSNSSYLFASGAMLRGYINNTVNKPTFASGLWRGVSYDPFDRDVGYVSVGLTNAVDTDENGCLWMSINPESNGGGTRLTYSRLSGGYQTSSVNFNKDGSMTFKCFNNYNGATPFYFNKGMTINGDLFATRAYLGGELGTRYIFPRISKTYDIGSRNYSYNTGYMINIQSDNSQLGLYAGNNQYGGVILDQGGYLFPSKNEGISLGRTNNRFFTMYLLNPPSISSDKRLKDDIHYVGEPITATNILNNRAVVNTCIDTQDMYNFVKDDLKIATYKFKENIERGDYRTEIGFIAQDILTTKVGSEIVELEDKNNLDSNLSYNQGNYISVLAGALQQAITKIELLEQEIKSLKGGA